MLVKKNILIILVIFIPLTLVSCMNLKQPSPEITYYTLEYDSPAYPGKERLPCIIKIENFEVSPLYDTTGIIYRKGTFERDSYTYYRWRVNPAELVTYLIGRDLKNSGLFKGVLLPGERNRGSTFRLEGMLDDFYELDGTKEWSGVLTLNITLIPEGREKASGMDIYQKSYSVTEKCERKNPDALAAALSRAMKKVSRAMCEDIYEFIKLGMKS